MEKEMALIRRIIIERMDEVSERKPE